MMASGAYFFIGVQPQNRASLPCFVGSQGLSSGPERFFKQSLEEFFSETGLPVNHILGSPYAGCCLCYSTWQVGLPKEAGSKEDKMSIFPTRILLATDGSEEATLAAQTAIDLANKTGSELHVVYADPLPYSPALYGGYDEGVDVGALQYESEELMRIGQGRLDEQVRKIKAAGGSVAQAHFRVGRPDT